MSEMPHTPFRPGWWSFGLGGYRPCDSTYCLVPYDSLPPLDAVDDSFAWLVPLAERVDQQMTAHRNEPEQRGEVEKLAADARARGLRLPASFMRLMSAPDLQDRIPSCTACTFELGGELLPCPGSGGAFIVQFLRDQQDCVLWYLYLAPDGGHCVLAFPGDAAEYLGEESEVDRQQVIDAFRISAPSFTDFIHRFWLENVLWFKLDGDDKTPLTAEEQVYVAHYARQNGHA